MPAFNAQNYFYIISSSLERKHQREKLERNIREKNPTEKRNAHKIMNTRKALCFNTEEREKNDHLWPLL